MIELRGLSRSFSGRKIFASGELRAPERGLVALTGANGCGKTTLLRILSTLTAPSSGEAWVAGHSLLTEPGQARTRLGFVPASGGGMFGRLTGRENLMLFAGLCGLSASQAREAIDRCRTELPLEQALDTRFGASSTGMRQALLVARALIHRPQVLLLDEPSRSLDAQARDRLWQAIEKLAASRLVLFSTHDPEERRRASLVWKIEGGELRCSASC